MKGKTRTKVPTVRADVYGARSRSPRPAGAGAESEAAQPARTAAFARSRSGEHETLLAREVSVAERTTEASAAGTVRDAVRVEDDVVLTTPDVQLEDVTLVETLAGEIAQALDDDREELRAMRGVNPVFTLSATFDASGGLVTLDALNTSAGQITPGSSRTYKYVLTNLSGVAGQFTVSASAFPPQSQAQIALSYSQSSGWVLPSGSSSSGTNALGPISCSVTESKKPASIEVTFTAPDAADDLLLTILLTATFTPTEHHEKAGFTQILPIFSTINVVPQVTVTAHGTVSDRGLAQGLTLTPGSAATDRFVITNACGSAEYVRISTFDLTVTTATKNGSPEIAHRDRSFTQFVVTDLSTKRVLATAKTMGELNVQLAEHLLSSGDSFGLDVTYSVPNGPSGAMLTDKLTALAFVNGADGSTKTSATSNDSVVNTLGSIGDLLATVVSDLATAEHGKPNPQKIGAVFELIDPLIEAFVNDGESLTRAPGELSRELAFALAIHDLSDGLYDRLISHDQVPLTTDSVP